MAADEDRVSQAADGHTDSADFEFQQGGGLSLTRCSPLRSRPGIPPSMTAELVRLRAAFPAFSFTIGPGWRGLVFEAWCDAGTGGLYAVITQDAAELWRELVASRRAPRPVAGTRGSEAR
jgi:hypothetical protein